MRRILLLILVIMFVSSIPVYAQYEAKIGFVDLSRAFDEYEKTRDFDKKLEKRGDLKQEQREKMVREIRTMREEMELLNETAREEMEKDIEAKIQSLQEFDQEAKTELTKERDDMVREILKEMNEIIQDYGSQNGYSFIMNDRVLLYGSSALDLTDEIIKILNSKYKR